MTEANAKRGEVSLMLEGEEYVMRPSHEAIEQVEEETGRTILQLAQAASEYGLSLKHASIAACRFIQAWGRKVENRGASGANPKRIGEMILESDGGLMVALLALTQVLIAAATGGYTASGEVSDRTMTKPPILSEDSQASA